MRQNRPLSHIRDINGDRADDVVLTYGSRRVFAALSVNGAAGSFAQLEGCEAVAEATPACIS